MFEGLRSQKMPEKPSELRENFLLILFCELKPHLYWSNLNRFYPNLKFDKTHSLLPSTTVVLEFQDL